MVWAAIGVGAASIIAGGVESYMAQGTADDALGMARNTQAQQGKYNTQLQALINDPSSFLTSGIFQKSLDQGLQGVSRQMASSGFLGSGNQATALESYGQGQALSALQGQEQLLASLSGLQSSASTAQSMGVAVNAQSAASGQLGGLLASLGYTTGGSSGSGGSSGIWAGNSNVGGNTSGVDTGGNTFNLGGYSGSYAGGP